MSKKVVLITGCSANSLGDALAQQFHATGKYRVFATARNPSKLSHFSSIGIKTLILDPNSPESIAQCVKQVAEKTGGTLDLLINNHGMQYAMPLLDADMEKVRGVFETNLFSYIAVTQGFMPLLLKAAGFDATTKRLRSDAIKNRTSAPGVVLHSSISSLLPTPWFGAYSTSKAAVTMLADTLRLELEPFGIRVMELKSGSVKSNILGKMQESADLPRDTVYAAAREKIEYFITATELGTGELESDAWAKQVSRRIDEGLRIKSWFSLPWTWLPERSIWVGGNVALLQLLQWFPIQVTDKILKDMTHTPFLAKALRSAKAT